MTDLTLPRFELGDAVPGPRRSEDRIGALASRRSTPAQTLAAPGPDDATLLAMLELAARTPDHGKLFPWRFVILEGAAKATFVERLRAVAKSAPDPDKATAALAKLDGPPVTICVISRAVSGGKIPEWEQILSGGAAAMNLLHAADAFGFGAVWITDWYAYDPLALSLLGLDFGERVIGWVHVGTPSEPRLERPRPRLDDLVSRWKPRS